MHMHMHYSVMFSFGVSFTKVTRGPVWVGPLCWEILGWVEIICRWQQKGHGRKHFRIDLNQSQTTRVPMWLSTDQTLAEMEPLVAHRLLCFRRRFWFSDLNLDQADRNVFNSGQPNHVIEIKYNDFMSLILDHMAAVIVAIIYVPFDQFYLLANFGFSIWPILQFLRLF